ncbi:hypothetical protein IE53DRAFT_263828 [Violaceomyces palustris]|uniref:Uncharacterized protein n=2 Tax=Violaceomyces palustris TaxID=1673888 RepID=A0ACD0P3H4_9BASI|nr:hypothetical protein IE53DRAFT_114292 [Violaceomyces palustris]PWN52645.1 hypothetical protein IE53DRAFT_263828 [Violaceomyces palustris]
MEGDKTTTRVDCRGEEQDLGSHEEDCSKYQAPLWNSLIGIIQLIGARGEAPRAVTVPTQILLLTVCTLLSTGWLLIRGALGVLILVLFSSCRRFRPMMIWIFLFFKSRIHSSLRIVRGESRMTSPAAFGTSSSQENVRFQEQFLDESTARFPFEDPSRLPPSTEGLWARRGKRTSRIHCLCAET